MRLHAPVWLRRLRAEVTGKSWSPCPVCGQHFGGHEWLGRAEDRGGHLATIWAEEGGGHSEAICPSCTRKGAGCISHAAQGRRHAHCPYLANLPQ